MKIGLAIALALGCGALTSLAQEFPGRPGPGGPPRGRGPEPMPLIRALDTDKDGVLNAAEIEAAPEVLAKLDKNGDGRVSPQELAPGPAPAPRGNRGPNRGPDRGPAGPSGIDGQRPPPSPVLRAIDTDGDGVLSAAEVAGASAGLKKLDTNNDGQLTVEEFAPPGPGGRGGREGRAPGNPGRRGQGRQGGRGNR